MSQSCPQCGGNGRVFYWPTAKALDLLRPSSSPLVGAVEGPTPPASIRVAPNRTNQPGDSTKAAEIQVCPDCGAANYGNAACPTCHRDWQKTWGHVPCPICRSFSP
jgi:ribosomal protein L32